MVGQDTRHLESRLVRNSQHPRTFTASSQAIVAKPEARVQIEAENEAAVPINPVKKINRMVTA